MQFPAFRPSSSPSSPGGRRSPAQRQSPRQSSSGERTPTRRATTPPKSPYGGSSPARRGGTLVAASSGGRSPARRGTIPASVSAGGRSPARRGGSLRVPTSCDSGDRPSSCPTQASLLRDRGALGPTRISFEAQLPKTGPNARPLRDSQGSQTSVGARLGIDLRRSAQQPRLIVAGVDTNPRNSTPVAQYNVREERTADRGANEKHASFALTPGDRIVAVNDELSTTGMLEQIKAAGGDSPRVVNLAVSRDLTDVLKPLLGSAATESPENRRAWTPASGEKPEALAVLTAAAVPQESSPVKKASPASLSVLPVASSRTSRRRSNSTSAGYAGFAATTGSEVWQPASRSQLHIPGKGSRTALHPLGQRGLADDTSTRSPSMSRGSPASDRSATSSPPGSCTATETLFGHKRPLSNYGRRLSHAGAFTLAGDPGKTLVSQIS